MTLLAQTTLIASSANSADNQSNGFYVSESGYTEANLDTWATAIKTFYEGCVTAGAMLGIAQNNHIIKFYDVGAPAPNYPVYETTFNLATSVNATDLPQEVALCVSYRNNTQNSVLRARRRGRIYISGWAESRNTAGRPTSAAYQGLAQAYKDYCDAVNVISGFTAVVYSRVQDITSEIEEVWCDDEWDTMRRRGGKPTARYSLSVTP